MLDFTSRQIDELVHTRSQIAFIPGLIELLGGHHLWKRLVIVQRYRYCNILCPIQPEDAFSLNWPLLLTDSLYDHANGGQATHATPPLSSCSGSNESGRRPKTSCVLIGSRMSMRHDLFAN